MVPEGTSPENGPLLFIPLHSLVIDEGARNFHGMNAVCEPREGVHMRAM